MPLVVALKSFRGRYGQIRTGTRFNCEPGYYDALRKNKLVALAPDDGEKRAPGPEDNRKKPDPPGRGGKDQTGGQAGRPGATEPPPAGGKAGTSASLRADLASRKKTSTKSVVGGRKGTPTPRKAKQQDPPPAG